MAAPALVAVLELDGRGVHEEDARPLRSAAYALARLDRALRDPLEVADDPVPPPVTTGGRTTDPCGGPGCALASGA